MTGACTTRAPSSVSRRASSLERSRERVTAIVLPCRGLGGSHASCCASEATGPTTVTDGGRTCSRCTASAMVASVPVTVRCPGSVPLSTTATGSDSGRPPAIRAAAISGSRRTPMYSTSVPGNLASSGQSITPSPGTSWPVTSATALAIPRWVTGIPAYALAATPAVTPGTTSKGTPAASSESASSPPRPKTNGSPPFSRTTIAPARARSTIIASVSAWGTDGPPGSLPTNRSSASARAPSSASAGIRRS